MKRYFYSDPLAAAWMAMHHGMCFETERIGFRYCDKTKQLVRDENPDTWGIVRDVFDIEAGDYSFKPNPSSKYYIHENSLPLLEPRIKDAVEFDRWFWDRQRFEETKDYPYQAHYGVVVPYGRNDEGLSIITAGMGWDNISKGEKFTIPFKIIQRDGKPFFWPESEDA
jgi:hypothetical protein